MNEKTELKEEMLEEVTGGTGFAMNDVPEWLEKTGNIPGVFANPVFMMPFAVAGALLRGEMKI